MLPENYQSASDHRLTHYFPVTACPVVFYILFTGAQMLVKNSTINIGKALGQV